MDHEIINRIVLFWVNGNLNEGSDKVIVLDLVSTSLAELESESYMTLNTKIFKCLHSMNQHNIFVFRVMYDSCRESFSFFSVH